MDLKKSIALGIRKHKINMIVGKIKGSEMQYICDNRKYKFSWFLLFDPLRIKKLHTFTKLITLF